MSRIDNSFTLTGHLGKDPETKLSSTTGKAGVYFSLALNEEYTDKQSGNKIKTTDWYDMCAFYEGVVSVIQKYLKKGSKVQVRGKLGTYTYTSPEYKNDKGEALEITRTSFIVTEVLLMGSNNSTQSNDDQNSQ